MRIVSSVTARTEGSTCSFSVGGMDCSGCARTVETALRALDGVEEVHADVMAERVTVRYAGARVSRADLVDAVRRSGYPVEDTAPEQKAVSRGNEGKDESLRWKRAGRLPLAALSGVLWAGSLVAAHLWSAQLGAALAIGAIASGGWYIVPRGLRAARSGALDMNFLMSVAAVGALLIGEYQEAATAMFLFAVAQLLESHSMDRARNAIRALMDLSPAEATVLRGGREERVPASAVMVGETVVVRPGEKIPVDGEVVAGCSSVNQAPITGESVPVEKEPGSEVFAGTLNGEGAVEVRASRPASDTTLARIIHAVEEAQATRAPSQAFVDRFARVYTPTVVGAALLLAVLPPLVGLGTWGGWFYRSLVLLVVACPCALVISTPVTVVSALAGAARRGILVKGGLHLENAGRARVVAFDKTGTLTEGRPEVVAVRAFGTSDADSVLALAASAEARSEHPLAQAIVRHAEERAIEITPAREVRAVPGRGLEARIDGAIVMVGSPRFFSDQHPLDGPASRALEEIEAQGRTAVLVATAAVEAADGPTLRGVIAMADRVRPEAAEALRTLRDAGVERIVMLTGDNPRTAEAVAREVGLTEYRAALLPQEKVSFVGHLREEDGRILMVGDGVNDAPALAAADVGVAMGSAGTDVALETADIALMGDDLCRLATTVRLARKAEGIIRANIWFALLTKAAFVVLAVLGLATLWMAVFADMGASLLVVANGLRALRE